MSETPRPVTDIRQFQRQGFPDSSEPARRHSSPSFVRLNHFVDSVSTHQDCGARPVSESELRAIHYSFGSYSAPLPQTVPLLTPADIRILKMPSAGGGVAVDTTPTTSGGDRARSPRSPRLALPTSLRGRQDPGSPEPPRYNFKLHEVIGLGGSGRVYRAEPAGVSVYAPIQEVAIKIVRSKGLSKRAQLYLAREIAVHKAVKDHPHICNYYTHFVDRDFVYIVLELLKGADLYSVLKAQNRGFSEKLALTIILQVLDALKYMHPKGIAHRDIKLENIMFARRPDLENTSTVCAKLIDFGLACARDTNAPPEQRLSSEKCGTIRYAAPEIISERPYVPEHADIWSTGIVLYSMIAHRNPFTGNSNKEVLQQIENVGLYFDGPAWRHVSADTKELLRKMLRLKGADRPSASECYDTVVAILRKLSAQSSPKRKPTLPSNSDDLISPIRTLDDVAQLGSEVTTFRGPPQQKKSDGDEESRGSDEDGDAPNPLLENFRATIRFVAGLVGDRGSGPFDNSRQHDESDRGS